MSRYREQRDRLNERVEMLAKLGTQMMQAKPDSLEHILLSKTSKIFWSANHVMNEELEKLHIAGLDQTIYPIAKDT
ncbi:hypothetical protein [Pseudomonas viridiflava]|uniref:hypothetical protein n=1 Tax=Pseudomonas viridiflava TaxID=33069 RepID=UPI000F02294F|nr:hypothetical protein [Pseudomonas viridiflava]VVM38478.1 hypothetical protein PS634_00149 [Pseudomonas fluorescens]